MIQKQCVPLGKFWDRFAQAPHCYPKGMRDSLVVLFACWPWFELLRERSSGPFSCKVSLSAQYNMVMFARSTMNRAEDRVGVSEHAEGMDFILLILCSFIAHED